MAIINMIRPLVIIFFLMNCSLSFGERGKVIQSEILNLFEIPPKKVNYKDLKEYYAKESDFGEPNLAFSLKPQSGDFAHLEFAEGAIGTACSKDVSNFFKTQTKQSNFVENFAKVKKVSLKNNESIFVGPVGGGSGGFTYLLYYEDAQNNYEYKLSITIPNDPPIKESKKNENHLRLIENGFSNSLVSSIHQKVYSSRIALKYNVSQKQKSIVNSPSNSTFNRKIEPQKQEQEESLTVPDRRDKYSEKYRIGLSILLIIFLVILALKAALNLDKRNQNEAK